MVIVKFMFNTLMSCILIVSILIILVIAMYLLKVMLQELFDSNGVKELLTKWKSCGLNVPNKKRKQ